MIGTLNGRVEEKIGKYLIVEVGGVGYRVGVLANTLSNAVLGQEIKLYIHPYIKEDAFDLYGFENRPELYLFELLLSVAGIGPKTALAILSSGKVEEISAAITQGDFAFFTNTPGIGTKGAQRIVVDLRSKIGAVGELDLTLAEAGERKDVIEALRIFGFTEKECREALKSLPKDKTLSLEEKVKWALKSLGR
jgi:Holliday junction DNA helicase RuvA